MNRRAFLGTMIGTSGALIAALAGGEALAAVRNRAFSRSGKENASCSANGVEVSIASNHGHELLIPKEDIAAGVEKIYSIQGESGHPHEVKITAEEFALLKSNREIMTVSSRVAGHTHAVRVRCA